MKSMNQIYYKPNTPKLRKEIYEKIAYKPENIKTLLEGWFELDPMPIDFFKAFWLASFGQGIKQEEILNIVKNKAVSLEKLDLIKTLLTMQLFKWEDFYKASIDNSNIDVLSYLVRQEEFLYNPQKVDELCIYPYHHQDIEFIKQVDNLLTMNHIKIKDYNYISGYAVDYLFAAILTSGQFDYINLAKKNLKLQLNENHPPLNSYHKSLDKNFYTFTVENQVNFLQFFMKTYDEKSPNYKVIIDYINSNKDKKNQETMAQVIHTLLKNKSIHLEKIKEQYVNPNYLDFFETYHEKATLDENINIQEAFKKTKKLKV
jgi:hypothetical protein